MFDMVSAMGDDPGYELRITYRAEDRRYELSGFIIHLNHHNRLERGRDGAPLFFLTLEAAIKHITGEKA